MANECSCVNIIHMFTHLPIPLVQIIQGYFHSDVREEFYQQYYSNFELRLRLDKKKNIVEEVKISPDEHILQCIDTKDLLIEINRHSIDTSDDSDRWLYIQFKHKKTSYAYAICLTTDTICTNNGVHIGNTHTYETMHMKLVEYFNRGNMNNLLVEIKRQGHRKSNHKDFERVWYGFNAKIAAWTNKIDFWSEIHR